jgi:hypothetical protein
MNRNENSKSPRERTNGKIRSRIMMESEEQVERKKHVDSGVKLNL